MFRDGYDVIAHVFEVVANAGGEARFVGGCVRDYLINKTPIDQSDIDVSVNLPVEEVARAFRKAGAHVITKYATNIVVFRGMVFEVTSTRMDTNCDGRYATMVFTKSFEEDARRRDFTMNALYMDLDGKVYDYHGGLSDLKSGIVRFIGNPMERIREDYLRVWRFFRFTCLFAGKVDADGLAACITMKDDEGFRALSKERVTNEMMKLLNGNMACDVLKIMQDGGVVRALNVGWNDKILEIIAFYDAFRDMESIDLTLVRFASLTYGKVRDDLFVYTRKQKKFLNIYQEIAGNLRSLIDAKVLFYKFSHQIALELLFVFCVLNRDACFDLKWAIEYAPPELPFCRSDFVGQVENCNIGEVYLAEVRKWLKDEEERLKP